VCHVVVDAVSYDFPHVVVDAVPFEFPHVVVDAVSYEFPHVFLLEVLPNLSAGVGSLSTA
jgi:hypothetical protein